MDRIVLDIKDESKTHMVISLLKELSFIEFKKLDKKEGTRSALHFRNLFGIWKGRDVTLNDLRQKAWQREIS